MTPRTAFFGMVVLGMGCLFLVLNRDGAVLQAIANDAFAGLVTGLAVLVVVGAAALGEGPIRVVVRNAMILGTMFLGLVTSYVYQEDVGDLVTRIIAEVDPSTPSVGEDGESVTVRRDVRGHFSARGEVNGAPIRFLIDTGATRVTLSAGDAEKIGIDLDDLLYTARVMTANGTTMVAPVRLDRIEIGAIRLDDVQAFVAPEGAMRGSLLGMSFLGRLPGYTVRGDRMTLLGPGG